MIDRAATMLTLAALTLVAASVPAAAAPPANDGRAQATPLAALPARVAGTLVEASSEAGEPDPFCGPLLGPTVWYRLDGLAPGRVALQLMATEGAGNVVTVYRREGGDLDQEVCDATDRQGGGAVFFTARRAERYLVQVGSGVRADAGAFVLQAFRPEPPPALPGPALGPQGAKGTVDVIRDAEDAFSLRMRAGTTYRLNLHAGPPGSCRAGFEVLAVGATDLDAQPVAGRFCGGYVTYTPGPDEGGVHSVVVTARPGARAPRYRLTAAPLGADDQAPGIRLPLNGRARGSVSGRGIDRLDLYRIQVPSRSRVRLQLATGGALDLRLLTVRGRRLGCACGGEAGPLGLERGLAAGTYLAVVAAQDGSAGRYRLGFTSREITSSSITVNGGTRATAPLGATATIAVRVSPTPRGGTVLIDAEQFDPLGGWRFRRRLTATVSGGVARAAFRPAGPGPWRFTGKYLGTRRSSPSEAGTARLEVTGG